MRLANVSCLICLWAGILGLFSPRPLAAHEAAATFIVPNGGQWPAQVLGHVDLGNLRIFIENSGFTWLSSDQEQLAAFHASGNHNGTLNQHAWRTTFLNSSFSGKLVWSETLPTSINYYLGNDPGKWATGLVPAKELLLQDIYPGIDLRIDVRAGFKYEFIVHPGANPDLIKGVVTGASLALNDAGELAYQTVNGTVREASPVGWTLKEGKRQVVDLQFAVAGEQWEFVIGPYAKDEALVLDPVLVGSTFSGATSDNWGFTATYGQQGDMFLGGINFNPGYPVTLGAYQAFFAGQIDMTISHYAQNASVQYYATYLGGTDRDYAMSLVTNAANELYLLGKTNSANFPMAAAPYDATYADSTDLVVVRLSASGGLLLGSTYLGGSGAEAQNDGNGRRYDLQSLEFNYGDDSRGEILIDSQGNVLIACNSSSLNFPIVGGFQTLFGGVQDGVVAKLNPNLSALLYSTYLGGTGMDAAYGIRSLGGDTVVVVGSTFSNNTVINALGVGFTRTHFGESDGFLLKMRTSPGVPLAGTYLGTGLYDQCYLVDTDMDGRIYVAGITMGSMPVLPAGVYFDPGGKQFVQRYDRNLQQLEISTVFGPSGANGPSISPTAFMVDICNKIYFGGWGGNTNNVNGFVSPMSGMPISIDAIQSTTDGSDMYLLVLDADATNVVYGTYFGGSSSREHVDGGTCRFSKEGVIYHAVCAGCGGASDFPTTTGAYSSTNNSGTSGGRCNGAIFNIDLEYVNPVAGFRTQYPDTTVCLQTPVVFNPTGTLFGNFYWDFGVPGATSTLRNPSYTYTSPGNYVVTLIVSTCIAADTITQTVTVAPPPAIQFLPTGPVCLGDSITLSIVGGVRASWVPHSTLADTSGFTVRLFALNSRWYTVRVYDQRGCEAIDSIFLQVRPTVRLLDRSNPAWCYGDTAVLTLTPDPRITSWNWLPDSDISDPASLNQRFWSLPARWVYLQLTDTGGCSYLDSAWLQPRISVFANGGPDRFVCGPDSVDLMVTGGSSYVWSTGETGNRIRVYTTTSTIYWVEAFVGNCRSLRDSILVQYAPVEADFQFSPDTAYAPQEVSFTNLSQPSSPMRYTWDFGDGGSSTEPNPKHVFREPGLYRIMLKAFNQLTGCTDSMVFEYLFVDSIQIILPNAFTPNGDNVNDNYKAVIRNLASSDFRVYDRWGGLVFSSNATEVVWNGESNGRICPPGIYPYVLEARGKNGLPYRFTGQIVLIR